MKRKLSYKKMLATVGALTVVLPMSLSIASCAIKEKQKNNNQKIVNAINQTNYSLDNIIINSTIDELKTNISSEFIKNSLDEINQKNFNNDLFSLNKIINEKNEEINNNDFKKIGLINAKINYNYGKIKNQFVDLKISVKYSDKQIVDAISETKYTKKVNFQSSVMELNDSINAEFIKNSLISEIKNSFKNNLFSLNKITNNKEIDLKDEDFTVSGSIDAKINYNYDSFKNLTTNLTIIIGEGQISNKYELNDGKINKFLQISDSIIFAATENGNIWEIDFTNNTKINKYQLNEERINSLIKASNGKVYAGTITNTVWEIDLETETAEKKFTGFGDKYDSKTLIEGSKDKLYVGTGIGNVYELDINTGNTKKYRFDDWGDVNTLVKITENKIYAGTSEGKLWEIDLETKTHKLKYDFKNKSNIIFDIKALSDTELILATEDKIYQYDLIKNEITEKINLKDGKIFSLSIEDLNNKIYATTDNNNVYELDLSFSQVKNKYELNASVYSSLIVDKKLFAGTITNVWELDIE